MITRKKVQKVGNGRGLLLTRQMLDVLNVDAGDTLVVRAVGASLVIHKDGAPELTPDKLAAFGDPPKASLPPDGLRAADAHLVAIVHEHGPLRTVDVARRASWTREWTSRTLNLLARGGWVVKTIAGWELGPVGRGWIEAASSDNEG